MPSTDIRDKAEEQHAEKRIPMWKAVLVVVVSCLIISLAGYYILSWMF